MCLPVCCRPIAQGLEKRKWSENMMKKYKIRHFTHTYASEPEEGEKEILLKNMPFDFA